ncbi:MAG: ion transporter [Gammaproteobacteria bacterium]|nr:ion transporter [Gammaproteobacteria bacterium]
MILALGHSIPRIGQMALLSSLLFYIYAVIGQTLFSQHDPQHWETLHISLLSLFRTLTLEDWTDLMYTGMELYPWAWVYFVSFVLLATFVIFNMLIGIILTSMEEAREKIMKEQQTASELHFDKKLEEIRTALDHIEEHLKSQKKSSNE